LVVYIAVRELAKKQTMPMPMNNQKTALKMIFKMAFTTAFLFNDSLSVRRKETILVL